MQFEEDDSTRQYLYYGCDFEPEYSVFETDHYEYDPYSDLDEEDEELDSLMAELMDSLSI